MLTIAHVAVLFPAFAVIVTGAVAAFTAVTLPVLSTFATFSLIEESPLSKELTE